MKTSAPNRNFFNYAFSVLLFAVAYALYYPTHAFDFAYDDVAQIEHNQLVTEDIALKDSIKKIIQNPTPPGNLYRPLTTLSYRLNNLWSGLDPSSYHLTNAILYGFVCVLVFWVFLLLVPDSFPHSTKCDKRVTTTALCLLSALLFTLHPVHVEAVANVVGRAELLACALGIISLLLSRWSFTCQSKIGFMALLTVGITCFALGVLSKESALTFALLLPFAQLKDRHLVLTTRFRTRLALWVIALLLCSVVLLLIRYVVLAESFFVKMETPFENPENALTYFLPIERGVHAFRILGDYLTLLFFPSSLSADYSLTPAQVFADTYSITGLLSILIVSVYLLVLAIFRNQCASFWGAWFFITFILTANVLMPIGTIMGERLLFTPSIGATYFVIWILFQVLRSFRYGYLVTSGIALILAYLLALATMQRIPIWQNNQTLFAQTLIDAPKSSKAFYNYAVYLRTDKNDIDQSERYFLETLKILPTHTFSMIALADIALEKKNYARVEYWYKRVLALDPHNYAVKGNLTKLLEFKQTL
jgi:tetratricopeptide (TPR) repeat protein